MSSEKIKREPVMTTLPCDHCGKPVPVPIKRVEDIKRGKVYHAHCKRYLEQVEIMKG